MIMGLHEYSELSDEQKKEAEVFGSEFLKAHPEDHLYKIASNGAIAWVHYAPYMIREQRQIEQEQRSQRNK